jgi:hypothetical protein
MQFFLQFLFAGGGGENRIMVVGETGIVGVLHDTA